METDIGREQQLGCWKSIPGQMMIREKCYLCERRSIKIKTLRYPTTIPVFSHDNCHQKDMKKPRANLKR